MFPNGIGYAVGTLGYEEWDQAIAQTIGARFNEEKNQWYLPLGWEVIPNDGTHTAIDKALVIFKKSEPTHIDMALPEIAIIRDSVTPATERLLSPTVQYKLPAPGAVRVSAGGQLGWSSYITQGKESSENLFYTIEMWSRYRAVSQQLLQIIKSKFPIHGNMNVYDSINNKRVYAVYRLGEAEITQINSMVDRIVGFSISIKCEGELTLENTSFAVPSFTGTTSSSPIPGITNLGSGTADGGPFGVSPDGIPADPNPGPGGLYGTGKVIIREGQINDP